MLCFVWSRFVLPARCVSIMGKRRKRRKRFIYHFGNLQSKLWLCQALKNEVVPVLQCVVRNRVHWGRWRLPRSWDLFTVARCFCSFVCNCVGRDCHHHLHIPHPLSLPATTVHAMYRRRMPPCSVTSAMACRRSESIAIDTSSFSSSLYLLRSTVALVPFVHLVYKL